ncbi:MAG: VWA domain-containing protein [Candidatus Aminicenantes bacterium]|nr:VWA domain-containing protein [Candidatus Aminicenantes bacterium]NLH76746.1 VWA domain-containing protein [Acidobacteriota bacterium]
MSRSRSFRSGPARRAAVLIALAALTALSSPAVPQSAPADRPPALDQKPQHEVSVVLKLVQVYVTDKKGRPVEDLGMGDFSVTDDGQPVVLTAFEKHTLAEGAAEEQAGPEPSPAPPASVGDSAPASTRKFFLFFDFAFNNGRGVFKARKAALHFLDTKAGPGDEVGILSYTMLKGVRVHEYLTRDLAKVREVVEGIGSKDIAGRAADLELQYWTMAQEPLAGAGGTSEEMIKAAAGRPVIDPMKDARQEAKRQTQIFILRLTDLARSLRYVPGQKHFLFFSTGVPASLIYGGQSGNPSSGRDRSSFDAGDRVLRTQNEDMYKEFGASDCAFYAFDTRASAKETDLFAYDSMTFESGGRGFPGEQGVFQDSTNIFQDDKTTGLNSLKRISDITGGRYYANINMFERNLEQVRTLTGTYYVLGYSATGQEDGRFREVKVAVSRPDCEVRAQSGYFNPKPFAAMSKLEKELHLYDLALNERSLSRLPETFPMAALAFPSGEGLGLRIVAGLPAAVTERLTGAKVEFVSLVFDAKNDVRDVRRVEVDPRSRRGRPLTFLAGVALEPGDYTCRLVVRDMETGRSAVGSARASVREAPPAGGLRLGTPLLLRAAAGGTYLEAGTPKGRAPLAWQPAYDFDRSFLEPAAGPVPRLTPRLEVLVPYAVPGTAEPEVVLTARLIDAATGAAASAGAALVGRASHGATETLTLDLPLDGLAPGAYHLYINAEDRVSGTKAMTRTTVTIAPD